MPQKVLQPSFSGGVFSPSLYSRVDLAKYSTGLKTAKNFFVHPHGGASNRQGTEYVAAAKTAAKKCRLVPFEFSLEQTYVLEMGEGYTRIYKDGDLLVTSFPTYSDATTYAIGDYVTRGTAWAAYVADYAHFYFYLPKGGVPPHATLTFRAALSPTGNLSIAESSPGVVDILFGDSAAKNSKANIRAALTTITGYEDFLVCFYRYDADELILSYLNTNPTAVSTLVADTAAMYRAKLVSSPASVLFPTGTTSWTPLDQYEITTPYLEADLPDLKFAQSADVLYITHPSYAPRMLVRYAEDDWVLETYAYENGPFMPSNLTKAQTLAVSATTGTGKTLTAASALFDTSSPSKHIGSLWQIRHNVAGQRVSKAYTGAASSTSIQCGKTWRLITGGTWTGSIDVEKSIDGGSTWTVVRGFSGTNDFNVNTYGDFDEPCLVRTTSPAFTSGTLTANLTTDAYEHTGIVKITAVASSTSATCDILTAVGDTAAAWDWSEGSWSNYRGWPRAVTFHQDRLCFAGTDTEPQTIWMTETGRYTSFARSVPIVDSDGISVNLPARKMNGIKNLTVLNDMVAMTTATEWSIGAGSGAPITPTSIQTACQGYRGCSDMAPVTVGNRILYFQPMGSILRDMGYSLNADGYDSDDITIMASHFFDNLSVVDMAYQQEPDSLLWCVRSDGALLSLTYMREQEVFAWTEHNTDGLFESVCSIPGDGYNEVWFVVKRTVNGAVVRYIERLATRMATTVPADQFFVDSGLTITRTPASTAVTGLSHLEGKTVAVLADGFVRSGLVVTGGAITLPEAALKVIVGLPYTCDLETLNVELNLNTGTTQGSKVKISDVTVRFLNTRGGYLGPDVAGLDPVVLNTGGDLGAVEPLHSVDYQQTLVSGYDVGGRILYRQTDPLPVTILAIIPVVTVGG